ncbi:hypothetical protein ACFU7T_30295 [Streptomyces sp. NPDC057555]|uniref:hypothetical protein n=1 Tax=Streptomyces sp. NPDC057555 TaxID=3346166 RepID=UPI0036906984
MTGMSDPVHLPDPGVVREPRPVAGCDVCAALARQRERARAAGNWSKVSDCNVEMRRHPHPKAVRA